MPLITRRRPLFVAVALAAALVIAPMVIAPVAHAAVTGTGGDGARVMGTVSIAGVTAAPAPLRGLHWAIRSSVDPASGAITGKPVFGEMVVDKGIDTASVAIMLAAAQGRVIPTVTIQVYQPGTTTVMATYTLTSVIVSLQSLADSARNGGFPLDEISFKYRRLTLQVGATIGVIDLATL